MEGSEEARRNAAETRQALKRAAPQAAGPVTVKREKVAEPSFIAKRKACTHAVALPDGWQPPEVALDEDLHGVPPCHRHLPLACAMRRHKSSPSRPFVDEISITVP
jgi:hypothetical protein